MKKLCALAILCAAVTLALCGLAEEAARPEIILYTYYRQVGWGDRVQVGCVDSQGGLWLSTGYDSELHWPYQTEEQLAWLEENAALARVGALTGDELLAVKSLISETEEQQGEPRPAACDAGTEASYAVRYDADGAALPILLGMSGDSCFGNLDPDAQVLYLALRTLFPQVTYYEGSMGPAGFVPVGTLWRRERFRAFFWYAPRPALRLVAGFGRRFAESHALSLPSADANKESCKEALREVFDGIFRQFPRVMLGGSSLAAPEFSAKGCAAGSEQAPFGVPALYRDGATRRPRPAARDALGAFARVLQRYELLPVLRGEGFQFCHGCTPYTAIPTQADSRISAMGDMPFLKIFLDPK